MFRFRLILKLHSWLVAATLLGLTGLPGCQKPLSEEDRIRQTIAETLKAVGEKDSRAVEARLTEDFLGNQTFRREQLRGLVHGYFIRYRNVRVAVTDLSIQVEGEQAKSEFRLVLTGGDELLPERLRWLQVDAEWLLQDGAWYVQRAGWRDVGSDP